MNQKAAYPSLGQSFGIAGIVIVFALFVSPLFELLKGSVPDSAAMFIYYVVYMGGAFAVVNEIRKKARGHSQYPFAIKEVNIIPFIIIGAAALAVGISMPIANLIPMPDVVKELFASLGEQKDIFGFLSFVIAAPVLEEMIFRGIILDGLLKRMKPWRAILIASALFGLVHLNPWQFVSAMVIGCFAGWLYYRTKSVFFPILAHAANNGFAYIAMFFTDTQAQMDMTLVEVYGGPMKLALAISGALLLAGICLYMIHRQFSQRPDPEWAEREETMADIAQEGEEV